MAQFTYPLINAHTVATPVTITDSVSVMNTIQCHIYSTHTFSLTHSVVCFDYYPTVWYVVYNSRLVGM